MKKLLLMVVFCTSTQALMAMEQAELRQRRPSTMSSTGSEPSEKELNDLKCCLHCCGTCVACCCGLAQTAMVFQLAKCFSHNTYK